MATVQKASLTVSSGGVINIGTGTGGSTIFTTASNEYAIINVTDFWLSQTSGTNKIVLGIAGVVVLQIGDITGVASATICRLNGITGTVNAASPIQLYVPPSSAVNFFITSTSNCTYQVTAPYTIFRNS